MASGNTVIVISLVKVDLAKWSLGRLWLEDQWVWRLFLVARRAMGGEINDGRERGNVAYRVRIWWQLSHTFRRRSSSSVITSSLSSAFMTLWKLAISLVCIILGVVVHPLVFLLFSFLLFILEAAFLRLVHLVIMMMQTPIVGMLLAFDLDHLFYWFSIFWWNGLPCVFLILVLILGLSLFSISSCEKLLFQSNVGFFFIYALHPNTVLYHPSGIVLHGGHHCESFCFLRLLAIVMVILNMLYITRKSQILYFSIGVEEVDEKVHRGFVGSFQFMQVLLNILLKVSYILFRNCLDVISLICQISPYWCFVGCRVCICIVNDGFEETNTIVDSVLWLSRLSLCHRHCGKINAVLQ